MRSYELYNTLSDIKQLKFKAINNDCVKQLTNKLTENSDLNSATEEVQLAAVNQDGYSIKFIKNPSDQVQLAAVKQDGYSIKYIKNPSYEVQLAAVNQDGCAIKFIKNPSINVLNECKHEIIKFILEYIHDYSKIDIWIFNKVKITNWPELDIIKKSLAHIN
jgi:hypothetical protein